MKKKVLILQNDLMAYRVPVFNALAVRYDVLVVHAGREEENENWAFQVQTLIANKKGPFYFVSGLKHVLLRQEIDVLIVMFDIRWVTYIRTFLYSKVRRKILWGHRFSSSWIVNWIRVSLMRRASAVLLYGVEEIERLLQSGICSKKIYVAPNTQLIENHKDTSSYPKDSLIFVGRLYSRKRVSDLLTLFSKILSAVDSDLLLQIVGDGPEKNELKKLSEALGIENRVIFHGEISDETQLRELYERSYCYVSPGPVGLAVIHSFSYGVPVFTLEGEYHGPEFQLLSHGENSRVDKDLDTLIDSTRNHILEKTKLVIMGQNSYKKFRSERSFERMIDGFMRAIEESD